ncbi:hypothetical protein ACFO60_07850, partial [Sphaerisporangium dianthi]
MAITEGRHNVARTKDVAPSIPVQNVGQVDQRRHPVNYVWAVVRLALGWTFLWAFADKLFGFGFATPAAKAWVNGGSPTTGFLKGTKESALGGFFTGLAGQAWVD